MSTYFITSATDQRRRIFQTDRSAQLMLDTLQHYRAQRKYLLHAFVVMPDHIHLLITPNALSIEQVTQFIKGGSSRKLASPFPVWQRSFTESSINNRQDYLARLHYIHQNPVRAKLCSSAADFKFSSAHKRSSSAAEAGPIDASYSQG